MSKNPLFSILALALSLAGSRAQTSPTISGEDLFKNADPLNGDLQNPKAPALPAENPPAKKDKANGQTEITADSAEFNNKTHIAIFIGNVIVKNPDFNVVCDKLTAYLKHDDKPALAPGEKPKATPAPPPVKTGTDAPATPVAVKSKGGLEKAIAEMLHGGKVLIMQEKQELDNTVSYSTGKGEKAFYNATTGEVTLTGWPEAKQGPNTGVAVEEGTVMIMTRDGKMRTEKGRTKFIIQDSGNDKPGNDKPASKP